MADRDAVLDLLIEWDAARRAGKSISLEELCVDQPELLDELSKQIDAFRETDFLTHDLEPASTQSTPQARTSNSFVFEHVNEICVEFRRQWASGKSPNIEDYLALAPERAHVTLLPNLVNLEIELRRSQGESPQPEDYSSRFPQFSELLGQLFFSQYGPLGQGDTSVPSETRSIELPAAGRLGEYELVREIGRGGFGIVFEARHARHGNRVALKTLPSAISTEGTTIDASKLHKLKVEFRKIKDINHKNIVGLHHLEADGDQWFFTMDYVEGVDFLKYVRPSGVLNESRLRSALPQLAHAVVELHQNNIIHRDLKPSNVLVSGRGHVMVLDFGLIAEVEVGFDGQSKSIAFAGTPSYAAPEQCGDERTFACDWYSVGVMLYEALTGRLPVESDNPVELLLAKRTQKVAPLAGRDGVPSDLAALCMDLLEVEPADRPTDEEVLSRLSSSVETTPIERPTLLVGRDEQLEVLEEAFAGYAQSGTAASVLISGHSGEGKTVLATQFLKSLDSSSEVVVLRGACNDRESLPYKAMDSLVDSLCSYLRSLDDSECALLLPDDISLLVRLFPVMRRVDLIAKVTDDAKISLDLNDQQVRTRAFVAFRQILRRLGRDRRIVLFVDDLQWGDSDSAEALFESIRPPGCPHIFFLGTVRRDEAEASKFLREWQALFQSHGLSPGITIEVGPLSLEQCERVLRLHTNGDEREIATRARHLHLETAGNPLFLFELLSSFDVMSDDVRDVAFSEIIQRKFQRLPENAESILSVIAVAGRPLALDEICSVANVNGDTIATLGHMRSENLVRQVGEKLSPRVDVYHDRIRHAARGPLSTTEVKRIHFSLARNIELNEQVPQWQAVEQATAGASKNLKELPFGKRIYDLAYHYDLAGEQDKAVAYSLLAAEQARRQFALEVAIEQYAVAKRNVRSECRDLLFRIAEGAGEAMMLLGRYAEASDELEAASKIARSEGESAHIEALQGEVAFKSGQTDSCVAFFENALRRTGSWVPRTWVGFAAGVVGEAIIQLSHMCLPTTFYTHKLSDSQELRARLFNRLTYPYTFRNTLKLVWAMLCGMNRAENLGLTQPLAFSYAHHAMAMSLIGWHARGLRYGKQAIEYADSLDDLWEQGHSWCWTGIGLYASGRYDQGRQRLSEAVNAFGKTGDLWELHLARFHVACSHYALGRLQDAAREADATFRSSIQIGDTRAHCSTYLLAKICDGDIPFEQMKSQFAPREEEYLSYFHSLVAEGLWHAHNGRTEESLAVLDTAFDIVRRNLLLNFHTVNVLPTIVSACRQRAKEVEASNGTLTRRLRARARRIAKGTAAVVWFFPTVRAHMLRERALLLRDENCLKRALAMAQKSRRVAEKFSAEFERASSDVVWGELAVALDLPDAEEQLAKAKRAFEFFERAKSEVKKLHLNKQ